MKNKNTIRSQATAAVVFDGNCNFCRRQIARIRAMDRAGQFEYVESGTAGLTVRFPQLAGADLNTGMRLVESDGRTYSGADAVHAIARKLPWLRRLAWIYRVPGIHAALRAVYAWIAANRYRFAGKCDGDACGRPTENR